MSTTYFDRNNLRSSVCYDFSVKFNRCDCRADHSVYTRNVLRLKFLHYASVLRGKLIILYENHKNS